MDSWSSEGTPAQRSPEGSPPAPARLTALTLGEILDGMFRILIAHWRVYVATLGLLLVPYYLLYGWATFAPGSGAFFQALTDPTVTQPPPTTSMPMSGLLVGLSGLATLFVTPMTLGLGSRIAAEAFEGMTPTAGGVWRATLSKFWALLGVVVLMVLAMIPIVILPAMLIGVAAAGNMAALAVVVVIVMFLAMFWIYTKLSLSFAVVVVERTGPAAALRRSWQLTRGRFWRVFGTLVLTYLIVFVLFALFVSAAALIGAPFGGVVAVIVGVIAYLIGGVLITPLVTNVLTLLYYDGRIRLEAYDLDVLTREVTTEPRGPEQPFG